MNAFMVDSPLVEEMVTPRDVSIVQPSGMDAHTAEREVNTVRDAIRHTCLKVQETHHVYRAQTGCLTVSSVSISVHVKPLHPQYELCK